MERMKSDYEQLERHSSAERVNLQEKIYKLRHELQDTKDSMAAEQMKLSQFFFCRSIFSRQWHSRIGITKMRIRLRLVTSCRFCNKLCARPPQCALAPCKLTFDLLTLKVVSESRVTWATSAIFFFLGLSVLDLGTMYATDRRRQTSDAHRRYASTGGIITSL